MDETSPKGHGTERLTQIEYTYSLGGTDMTLTTTTTQQIAQEYDSKVEDLLVKYYKIVDINNTIDNDNLKNNNKINNNKPHEDKLDELDK